MSPWLVALGVAVVVGAIVAVTTADGRAAVLGLLLTLVTAPLMAAFAPEVLALAARLIAAVLAGYLLWVALRTAPGSTRGSRLGWPVEALAATGAAVVGIGVGQASAAGVPEALAVGLALAVLSIGPLATRRDALQLAIGVLLVIQAAMLIRVGLAGPPSTFEHLVTGGLVAGVGAAGAVLVAGALGGTGSLDLGRRRGRGASPVPERR